MLAIIRYSDLIVQNQDIYESNPIINDNIWRYKCSHKIKPELDLEICCRYNAFHILEYIKTIIDFECVSTKLYPMKIAIRNNSVDCLQLLAKSNNIDIQNLLGGYFCQYGYMECLKFIGQLPSAGIYSAIFSDNIEIFEYLAKLYPVGEKHYEYACNMHANKIIKYILERFEMDANKALSCYDGDDIEMVKYFINRGANNAGNYFTAQCCRGNIPMIKFLMKNVKCDYDNALKYACRKGNIELATLLAPLGDKSFAFQYACRNGNPIIINLLGEQNIENLCLGLMEATTKGFYDLVVHLVGRGANNFNQCAELASRRNHMDILIYLFSVGADNYDRAFIGACITNSRNAAEYLMPHATMRGIKRAAIEAFNRCSLDVAELILSSYHPRNFNYSQIKLPKKIKSLITSELIRRY